MEPDQLMLRLWVIRHAKSSWTDSASTDHDRDLNARGRRDAPRMASWLAEQPDPPRLLLVSDALRTRRTADFLISACALPEDALRTTPDLYGASADTILDLVRLLPPDCPSVAVVGHNPGIGNFANALVDPAGDDHMPTLGIAGFDLPGPWATTRYGRGRLQVLVSPKRLVP